METEKKTEKKTGNGTETGSGTETGTATEKKYTALCEECIKASGYSLVRVSFRDSELCFYIDKDGGVDLNDCEKVTKRIEPLIEANDTDLGENYRLSVSSIGTDGKDWE
jgi:ribosome maturation factor RimP